MSATHTSVLEKLLIPLLIADLLIAAFYFVRISDLLQEIWTGAYEEVAGGMEMHHLGALVFTAFIFIIPLAFYGYNLRVENLYFRNISLNSNLMTIFLIIGNVSTFLVELLITFVMFEVQDSNLLAGQTSEYMKYAGWALALLLPIFHQVSANFTIVSVNLALSKRSNP